MPRLARQSALKDVYIGVSRDGTDVYVGITKNLATRFAQHGGRFALLRSIGRLPEYQARAIEQAVIDANPLFQNKIASIAASRAFSDEARIFGQAWLAEHAPYLLG